MVAALLTSGPLTDAWSETSPSHSHEANIADMLRLGKRSTLHHYSDTQVIDRQSGRFGGATSPVLAAGTQSPQSLSTPGPTDSESVGLAADGPARTPGDRARQPASGDPSRPPPEAPSGRKRPCSGVTHSARGEDFAGGRRTSRFRAHLDRRARRRRKRLNAGRAPPTAASLPLKKKKRRPPPPTEDRR